MSQVESFTDVNEAVAHASTARELVLSDRDLRTLPKQIAKLTKLETLDISANPLRKLPAWLFELKTLRVLHVEGTALDQIPDAIGSLSALEELYVGGFDSFTELPESLGKLAKLRKLDLTDANSLTTLPECIHSMPALEELHLVRTSELADIDDLVAKLPRLRTLVVDDISLASLPNKPGSWSALQSLTLARTQLTSLPDWIGSLDQLRELRIDSNSQLAAINPKIGELTSLRVLDVRLDNPIAVPETLGKLTQLERLALVRCALTELPPWLFGLTNLTWLYLGLNPIERVSHDITRLQRLAELDLGNNPKLAPQRAEIIGWLPSCKVNLKPVLAAQTPAPSVVPAKPAPPPPPAYKTSRNPAGAASWPELSRVELWVCLDDKKQTAVTKALAKALGSGFTPIDPWGTYKFPRFEDSSTGLVFIAVAGDRFQMGLSDSDKRELGRRTKTWSDEAKAHVQELAQIARPAHEVHVPPFLCVDRPITAAHAAKRMPSAQSIGEVCLFDPSSAVSYAKLTHTRLLTEAEWEFVARGGSLAAWLSQKTEAKKYDPEKIARDALAKGLDGDDGYVFGIRGLAWGSWVEDAWHPSYQGAPADGSAWEPRELPEVVRGGALLSWPWQIDGEALLLHVNHRERELKRKFPLLLARDLPANR